MEIKNYNIKEVFSILESGKFDSLKKARENDVFEAKPTAKPYDLDNTNQSKKLHAIAELSSDITSFANQRGGVIVCGLVIDQEDTTPHDIILSVNLIKKSEFYSDEFIQKIIKTSVHPPFEPRIKVKWYPSIIEASMGLGAIYVPRQNEEKKYFIVRVCEIGDKKLKGFVGVPIRTDDQTQWLDVKEIYKLTKRKPSNFQELAQVFSNQIQELGANLSQKIDSLNKVPRPTADDSLSSKITKTLNE